MYLYIVNVGRLSSGRDAEQEREKERDSKYVCVYVCVCVWCAHAFVSFVNVRREPGGTGEIAREREQERSCARERSHETEQFLILST